MKFNRVKQFVLFGLLFLIVIGLVIYRLGVFDPVKQTAAKLDAQRASSQPTQSVEPTQASQSAQPGESSNPKQTPQYGPTNTPLSPIIADRPIWTEVPGKPTYTSIPTWPATIWPAPTNTPGTAINTAAPELPYTEPEVDQVNRSKVAIVQSLKQNVKDIQYDEIKSLVRQAVEMSGGLKGLVKDGSTVAIKPNLVWLEDYTLPGFKGRPLAKEGNGVTTDWRVTKAVVELVRELNPNGKVYVMEGCAGPCTTKEIFEYFHYTHEYIPGVDEFIAIEDDSGKWKEYNSPGLVKVNLPNGLLHKEYYLNKKYKEADVLISIPCLKNHWSAAISGAIKNVGIGATPANIYGMGPTNINRTNMVDHDTRRGDLHMWIHDYFMSRPVDFVVMDGLQGVQNGPTPCYDMSKTTDIKQDQMNMRLILAGRDAIAVDTIESLVMGWDPQRVGHLLFLWDSGAGNLDTSKITVVGKAVDEVRKYFAGRIPPPGGAKITDKEPPSLTVKKSSAKDGSLNLSLAVGEDTIKVEVYVDGKLCGPIITSNYGNINMNIGKGTHEIKIRAYDRFLNHSESVIKNLVSLGGSNRLSEAS